MTPNPESGNLAPKNVPTGRFTLSIGGERYSVDGSFEYSEPPKGLAGRLVYCEFTKDDAHLLNDLPVLSIPLLPHVFDLPDGRRVLVTTQDQLVLHLSTGPAE